MSSRNPDVRFYDITDVPNGEIPFRPDVEHFSTSKVIDDFNTPNAVVVSSCSIKFFLDGMFLLILISSSENSPVFLLLQLEFPAESLISHYVSWASDAFFCVFIFPNAYILVKKRQCDDFVVEYVCFDKPERDGNSKNGGFPKAGMEFNYMNSESKKLVQLVPLCPPMILRDASDESYNFARLNVHVDPEKNFLFFVFRSLSFSDEDEDEDREFEMKAIEFSFPIRSSGRSISSPIDFGSENCGYVASFTIKIGDEDYNVRFSFGTFESYTVDHRDGYYTLSAINNCTDSTTIFCRDTDAEELMERTMTRLGILSIEIPEFVAPETDDDSALVDALRHLPEDLQAFLRSITWCNPETRIAQFARASGSN